MQVVQPKPTMSKPLLEIGSQSELCNALGGAEPGEARLHPRLYGAASLDRLLCQQAGAIITCGSRCSYNS